MKLSKLRYIYFLSRTNTSGIVRSVKSHTTGKFSNVINIKKFCLKDLGTHG